MARKASLSVDVILFISSVGVEDMMNAIAWILVCCSPKECMVCGCGFLTFVIVALVFGGLVRFAETRHWPCTRWVSSAANA